MTNEYGAMLDRNGYAPSLRHSEGCIICGRADGKLDRHEVYHGANRSKSKRLGLWVRICHGCHMELHGSDAGLDAYLKRMMQAAAMKHYGWSEKDFIGIIGKNYL